MDWLVNLLSKPGTATPILILAVTIGIPALAWTVVSISSLVARHRERIALIEQGIDPDAHVRKADSKASI